MWAGEVGNWNTLTSSPVWHSQNVLPPSYSIAPPLPMLNPELGVAPVSHWNWEVGAIGKVSLVDLHVLCCVKALSAYVGISGRKGMMGGAKLVQPRERACPITPVDVLGNE